ncbi:hypothetical protein [Marinobacter sp.]|uniref:hypothetical protein n=1 Tax=Marinobacter sp. TaxID=50741 RepID=UPI003A933862
MFITVAFKALVIWLAIVVLAIANGSLREFLLVPVLGTQAALMLSGLLLSVLIVGVVYLLLPWLHPSQPLQVWGIGLAWLALTLIFEFSFGLLQGKSWAELLGSYTFEDGNLWLVVLATTVLAPYIAAKLRGWHKRFNASERGDMKAIRRKSR